MTEPTIRPARSDEGFAIAELWLRARRTAQIPPAVHSDDEVRGWVNDVLLPSGDVWVVAARNGEVVAMMALSGDELDQLYVSPEHQRQGHGTRLLEFAQARRNSLALWTFESNLVARRFYEQHGFVSSGPVSFDNEEHAPAIRYRWPRTSDSEH